MYTVRNINNHFTLNLFPVPQTFEETVEAIQKVVDKAKENGYNDNEKYLIIKVEITTDYTTEGIFLKSVRKEEVEGIYDNGKITH